MPQEGKQIAFDLIVNQNEQHARAGWIEFSPGVGIGFHPQQYYRWTLTTGSPIAGLRIGGIHRPLQGALHMVLPDGGARLVIHNGGLRALTLLVNGRQYTFTAGSGAGQIALYGNTSVHIGALQAGSNTVEAQSIQNGPASAALLSFFAANP